MTTILPTKDLGEQVNALRIAAKLKPYANPAKLGRATLEQALDELTKAASFKVQVEEAMQAPPPRAEEAVKAVAEQAIQEKAVEPPPAKGKKTFRVTETVDVDALVQPGKQETIRAMSERLLLHVHATDPADRRTVGLMYGTIIALIKMKFTKAETSIECLRWYGVHMRAEDKRLPQKRPRPSNKL